MKRLNDEELTHRIRNFMDRKMQEFPELKPSIQEKGVLAARETNDIFRTTNRFGFHWHNTSYVA